MKYTETMVTFSEVPDEVTLCINISNCPNHCKGCHSTELWLNIGTELTVSELDRLIESNDGITCVSLMGGDQCDAAVILLCAHIKEKYPSIKTCWYTGRNRSEDDLSGGIKYLDYIKIGPYVEELGPLTSPTTNQRFYRVENEKLIDITEFFWK